LITGCNSFLFLKKGNLEGILMGDTGEEQVKILGIGYKKIETSAGVRLWGGWVVGGGGGGGGGGGFRVGCGLFWWVGASLDWANSQKEYFC